MSSLQADLLGRAVDNNVAWCAAVCRASGLGYSTHGGVWVVDGPAPARYPAVITTHRGTDPAEVIRLAPQSGVAVKDSYDDVDLTEAGGNRLFTACWYGLSRGGVPAAAPRGTRTPADSAEGLARWSTESGAGDVLHEQLLRVPGFSAVLVRHDGRVVAGATVLVTNGFAGVTNLFTKNFDLSDASLALAAHLFTDSRTEILGGYEQKDELDAALRAGAKVLGPLSVWLTP